MPDEHLRHLMEHADDLIPVLWDHARKLAARHFRWHDGKTLPLGKTPEDIVTEVYVKYMRGERTFDPQKDLMIQLKGSVRSLLWALHTKASAKNELRSSGEASETSVVDVASNDPTPAEAAESADFAKAVVQAARQNPTVQRSKDLQDLLAAYELGATTVEQQRNILGKDAAAIHQLRHQLRTVYRQALEHINKN